MAAEKEYRNQDEAVEKACSAFCEEWLAGENPDIETFCRQFPDIAGELRESIHQFMETVQQLKQCGDSSSQDPSQAFTGASPRLEGEKLGDFHLVREVGRGGMGVVYEARQVSLDRTVALKVLPAHLTLRRESVARFQREASTAARLKHPGLVEIYAIGEDKGNHFFAMEFLEGAPLDKVIQDLMRDGFSPLDGRRLGKSVQRELQQRTDQEKSEDEKTREERHSSDFWNKNYIEVACRIIIQVAVALDHAHRSGVIHRDVKPSNILVRPNGIAVLTDFGMARDQGLPSLTVTGDLAGTPHYIAPEQVSGKRKPLDQRVDIYSLGVTLYEFLTLIKPFHGNTSQEVMAKIVASPPTSPRARNPLIPKDLETICLTAMEKEPNRRYRNALEFSRDLLNFLEFKPIQARPVGLSTRTFRLIRRNPAYSSVFGLLFLLIIVGPMVFGIQQKLANLEVQAALEEKNKALKMVKEERDAKEEALQIAEEEAATALQVTDFLVDVFQLSNPQAAYGKKVTAYELLQKGASSIRARFIEQPSIQVRLMTTMGSAFSALGLFDDAERVLKEALKICQIRLGKDSVTKANIQFQLGEHYLRLAQYNMAEPLLESAVEIARTKNGETDSQTLMFMERLATLYSKQGKFKEAETMFSEVLGKCRDHLGMEHEVTIECLMHLGSFHIERNLLNKAEPLLLDCLEASLKTQGADHYSVAMTSVLLGSLYHKKKDREKAEYYYLQALDRNKRIYSDDALSPGPNVIRSNLAILYMEMNRWEEAEPLLKQCTEYLSHALGADHPNTLAALSALAHLYLNTDRLDEADPLARKVLANTPRSAPEYGLRKGMLDEILRRIKSGKQKKVR